MTILCRKCNESLPTTAKFCTKCGISTSTSCTNCGADMKVGAKHCMQCGTSILRATLGDFDEGMMINGEWHRGKGEFVRKVSIQDMQTSFESLVGKTGFWGSILDAIGEKSIKIPNGCICAVVENGIIKEILPPGKKTTVGWFNHILERNTEEMPTFYLIDRSPIPIFSDLTIGINNEQHDIRAIIHTHIVGSSSDTESLNRFLQTLVADKDTLHIKDLHSQIKGKVQNELKRSLLRKGTDLESVEHQVTQEVNAAVGREFGLRFTASLTLEGSTKSINLHLGQNKVPQTKNCTNTTCGKELKSTIKFCTFCGDVQPTFRGGDNPTGVERPIISEDGQHVEFDMVLQFYGQGKFTHQSNEEMLDAIASAISRVVGLYKYTDIAGNFHIIENAVSEVTNRIAQTLNLKLTDVTVLDIRSKTQEWEMNTRADMERVKKELEVGHEWLGIEQNQAELQRVTLELVRSQKKMQREHDFMLLQEERQAQLERQAFELEANRKADELNIADQEARQGFLDREAGLEINNATRDSNTAISLDEQQRKVERHIAEQDHVDNLKNIDLLTEANRKKQGIRREDEQTELTHRQNLENQTIDNDLNQKSKIADNQRQQDVLDAQNSAMIADIELESHIKASNAEQDLDERRKKFDFDIDEQQKQSDYNRDETAKEKEHNRKQEAWQALQESQFKQEQLEQAHHKELRKMEQEERLAEIEAQRDIGTNEKDKEAAIAAAKLEMAEKMNEQLLNMFQMSNQSKDAHHQEMKQAYKNQADQAREMSQTAMNNMGQVAASRASGGFSGQVYAPPQQQQQSSPQQANPHIMAQSKSAPTEKACVKCSIALPLDAGFCADCGTQQ